MYCYLCGKKIGLFRRMVDSQYCCAEHRHEARLASARALREADEYDEPWSVLYKKRTSKSQSAGQTATLLGILTVAALVVAFASLPSSGGASNRSSTEEVIRHRGLLGRAGDALSAAVRSRAPVTLHFDSRSGWRDWVSFPLHTERSAGNTEWAKKPAGTRNSLRIWRPSAQLANYQMEFLGELQNKTLSWAFRATDAANYYATRIVILKPGVVPNAGLVRYVMLNGKESDRVQLPIPVTLQEGASYRVRVTVDDDHFITSVNGQVVSAWSDQRLHRGGVGFFTEAGAMSPIQWVNVYERDSFLGRMLAHFSLIRIPAPMAP